MRMGRLLAAAFVAPGLVAGSGTFAESVLSTLRSNCTPCHDAANRTSGLSVLTADSLLSGGNRRGPAVIAGSPEHSRLIQALRGTFQPRMPPGGTLPAKEIGVIEAWFAR